MNLAFFAGFCLIVNSDILGTFGFCGVCMSSLPLYLRIKDPRIYLRPILWNDKKVSSSKLYFAAILDWQNRKTEKILKKFFFDTAQLTTIRCSIFCFLGQNCWIFWSAYLGSRTSLDFWHHFWHYFQSQWCQWYGYRFASVFLKDYKYEPYFVVEKSF